MICGLYCLKYVYLFYYYIVTAAIHSALTNCLSVIKSYIPQTHI